MGGDGHPTLESNAIGCRSCDSVAWLGEAGPQRCRTRGKATCDRAASHRHRGLHGKSLHCSDCTRDGASETAPAGPRADAPCTRAAQMATGWPPAITPKFDAEALRTMKSQVTAARRKPDTSCEPATYAFRCADQQCPIRRISKVKENRKPQVKGSTWGS